MKVRADLLLKLKNLSTHRVVRCEDGCYREDMMLGTHAQCLQYLRQHWRSKLNRNGSELHLQDAKTGRFVSFML